jgi:flavodoxin
LKTLIIVHSYHQGNTAKIADAIAEILESEIKTTAGVSPDALKDYDLIGFGAGIDSGHHYKELLELAGSLPAVSEQKAFIFSTSGIYSEKKMLKDHRQLRDILLSKGYGIVGEFGCHGHDTVAFLKVFGGLNKGRPNGEDIQRATKFAQSLK